MVHQPRLCWEGARVFARAAASDEWYGWLADQLGRLFGPGYRQALVDSRTRLLRAGQRDGQLHGAARDVRRSDPLMIEIGMWRARLEDLLRAVPEASVALAALTDEVSARLSPVPA